MVTGQNGETGWIRRELVHLHPWNNPTDEQLTAMKRSAKLLTQSAVRNSIGPEFSKAVDLQLRGLVDLNTVRKEIPADSVLVEILKLEPIRLDRIIAPEEAQPKRYVAWIVPPSGEGKVTFIELGEADRINKLVSTAQATILESPSAIQDRGPAVATKIVREAMAPLFSEIWQPIQKAIGSKKKIILSPDADLWLVPWAAIPTQDNKFLVETFDVRLMNTGRDLLTSNDNNKLNPPVIIADPAFNSASQDIEDAIRILELDPKRTRSINFNSKTLGKVSRLPGTRREAEIVKSTLSRQSNTTPEVFLGNQAVFKSLERPETLMLGTHGFVLDASQSKEPNPLSRCGLLMAGFNDAQDAKFEVSDDGVLTGTEIIETDLRGTRLVVLSACQTGLGAIQDGEGVAGLRQAFQLAGAESVVATLWEISDDATVKLMVAFFSGLSNNESKSASLRAAQIKRIAALRSREGAAHPFFWAAFTLTGQD